ncbi:unnamed protein product [Heligmosomoides polygyrus]|uniref:CBFD_NFYB_HMF domain-containing protein n=1 Tax=Heligmosomoides polygyrus TaxID=6339 RepID=A0A3P8FM38_HELPZ|nr:unnamed protein product [Heligmosomoides polygyrus]
MQRYSSKVFNNKTNLVTDHQEQDGGSFSAASLSMKAQKKIASKLSTRKITKLFLSDAVDRVFDTLYSALLTHYSKKDAEKGWNTPKNLPIFEMVPSPFEGHDRAGTGEEPIPDVNATRRELQADAPAPNNNSNYNNMGNTVAAGSSADDDDIVILGERRAPVDDYVVVLSHRSEFCLQFFSKFPADTA